MTATVDVPGTTDVTEGVGSTNSSIHGEGTVGAGFALNPLQQRVFQDRYARRDTDGLPLERTPEEMWQRVAAGIAAVEQTEEQRHVWALWAPVVK